MNPSTRLSMNSEHTHHSPSEPHMTGVFIFIVAVTVVVVYHLDTCQTIFLIEKNKVFHTNTKCLHCWLYWLAIQHYAHMTVNKNMDAKETNVYAIFCISSAYILYAVCSCSCHSLWMCPRLCAQSNVINVSYFCILFSALVSFSTQFWWRIRFF